MKLRARHLIGRKVVAVDFNVYYEPHAGHRVSHLNSITLDNGRVVRFDVREGEDEHRVIAFAVPM